MKKLALHSVLRSFNQTTKILMQEQMHDKK